MQDGAKASTLHEIELRRATRAVVDADKQRISAHIIVGLVSGAVGRERLKSEAARHHI